MQKRGLEVVEGRQVGWKEGARIVGLVAQQVVRQKLWDRVEL